MPVALRLFLKHNYRKMQCWQAGMLIFEVKKMCVCAYVLISPVLCVLSVVQVPWSSVQSSSPLSWKGMLLSTSEDVAQGIFTPCTTKHLGSRGWRWKEEPVLLRRSLNPDDPVPPEKDGLRFNSHLPQSQQQPSRAVCQFQLSGLLSRRCLGNRDLPPFKYHFTQE